MGPALFLYYDITSTRCPHTSISGGGKLLTDGELIYPASLKRKEEALPMAKLEQLRYKKKVPIPERIRTFECQMVTQEGLEPPTL